MKILYLIHQFYPEFYSGTEKYVFNVASMMQKAGNNVKVLTYSFYDKSFYDRRKGNILIKEFHYKGLPVLALRNDKIPLDCHYSCDNKDLAEVAEYLISREKPDLVHVGHPMRVTEIIRVLPSLGIPFIVTLSDFFLLCPKINLTASSNTLCLGPEGGSACEELCPELPREFIAQRLRIAHDDILLKARRLVAPSRFLASIYKSQFEHLELKVINHGLNYNHIVFNSNRYPNDAKMTFCYAGSISQHKGVHVILEAFSRLESKTVALKIYGSGTDEVYANRLQAMAKSDDRIEFCGVFSEEEIGHVLKEVDVLILPSLCYESYSFILHEAFASGVPVVGSNVGAMQEKISDGENGFLFRIGDADHLAQILGKIVQDPRMLNHLKDNLNNIMIQSIEQEAHTYEREYKNLLYP